MFNEQPKWNYEFEKELMFSKTALNLSRGGPSKYCSSNRIASLMGNGILSFIDEKVKYQDFFDNDPTYNPDSPLIDKELETSKEKTVFFKGDDLMEESSVNQSPSI